MTSSTLDITSRLVRGVVSNAEPCHRVGFYLGTHQPGWLNTASVSLFISDRRLRGYRRLPRARTMWALDSGGFTELSVHGGWQHGPTPAQYAARVRRYRDQIGKLAWAAPQDWMCEPWITAKTGLSVAEHQHRTVANYLQLRHLASDLPIVPVVQGYTVDDYLRCVDRYAAVGIDLSTAALVGVGSICRRQATTDAAAILTALHRQGVRRLHGFGIKTLGLRRYPHLLTSADSMAWSAVARRQPPLPGCTGHINCANCPRYAYQWRTQLVHQLTTTPAQPTLFDPTPGRVA